MSADLRRRIERLERAALAAKPAQLVRLSLVPGVARSPEVVKWLAETEMTLNAEAKLRWHNLMVYGTTHPEMAIPCSPKK